MGSVLKITGIYKITSPSGKVYVGQSVDIYRRWIEHRAGCNYKSHLQYSFSKYGYDNHRFEILEQLPHSVTQDDLNQWEQKYIDLFRVQGISLMNAKDGGSPGKNFSASYKKKLSENAKLHAKNNPDWLKRFYSAGVAAARDWHSSEEGIQWHKEHAAKHGIGHDNYGEAECGMCKEKFIKKKKHQKFCHANCKAKHLRRRRGASDQLHNAKPVLQYNDSGVVVGQFKTMKDAAKNIGVGVSAISQACSNKRRTIGGYRWKYAV